MTFELRLIAVGFLLLLLIASSCQQQAAACPAATGPLAHVRAGS
jgi:hypothetical protein